MLTFSKMTDKKGKKEATAAKQAPSDLDREVAKKNKGDTEWSSSMARMALFVLCLLQGPIMAIKIDEVMRPMSALEITVIGLQPRLIEDYQAYIVSLLLPGQIFQNAFASAGYCAMAAVQDSYKNACQASFANIFSDSEQAVAAMIGPEIKAHWNKAVEGNLPYIGLGKYNALMTLTGLVTIGSLVSLVTTWVILALLVPVLMLAVMCSFPTVQIMPGLMLCGLFAMMTLPPGGFRKVLSKAAVPAARS